MRKKYNLNCQQIANITEGKIKGNDSIIIDNFNRIEYAEQNELTFYSDSKYEKHLINSNAGCILVDDNFKLEPKDNQCIIFVPNAYYAFIKVLQFVSQNQPKVEGFIHPTAVIDKTSTIGKNCYIGPYSIIGKFSTIGDNSIIKSLVSIGDNVSIGNDTIIYSNVVCYDEINIGNNCIIHSGTIIGSDGFGFIENDDGSYMKIPQLGNVIIGDNVEIGSNTTIDSAISGSTVIQSGVKIDNLVHIAHNVIIGENSALTAQVGIAGSTKIGKRNRFGGQVGLIGHITTTDDVIIAAQSGVSKSITQKGIYFGSPIKEKMKAFRLEAILRNLPEIYDDLLKLIKESNQK